MLYEEWALKNYNYDPVVTGVFVGIGSLVIWYFSCLAIDKQLVPGNYEFLAGFLSTLTATFVGAFLAFKFNSKLDQKKLEREKVEFLYNKLHAYSRAAKRYLWSIKRESGNTVRDNSLAEEARELIYECELYKHMYFEDVPLEPSYQYAELERLAGECDKHWSKIDEEDIQSKLDTCKLVGSEVQKFDQLIAPINKWCLDAANRINEK